MSEPYENLGMHNSDSALAQAMMELLADERSDDSSRSLELFKELAEPDEWNSLIHSVVSTSDLDLPRAMARGMQIALRAADVARRRRETLTIPKD